MTDPMRAAMRWIARELLLCLRVAIVAAATTFGIMVWQAASLLDDLADAVGISSPPRSYPLKPSECYLNGVRFDCDVLNGEERPEQRPSRDGSGVSI